MAAERTRVPNMVDTFMYTNHPIDVYPGFGAPPTYRPLQNVQPYEAKVGLDPFPCNVPQTTQVYESHNPLGTQNWNAADSEWTLKDSRVREAPAHEPRRNPITKHEGNRTGFLHTGSLGSERRVEIVDPRHSTPYYGNNKPMTLDYSTRKSNLLSN